MTGKKRWIMGGALLLCAILVACCIIIFRHKPASRTSFLLAEGLDSQTECYILDSGQKGPTVFLLAGTHGNETAGFKAAEMLVDSLEPLTGKVILVPHANQQAIERDQRTAPNGEDMNRSYPGSPEGSDIERLADEIMSLIREYEPVCVVDMHEGFNFYGVEGSIGNSLVVGYTQSGFTHALDILSQVNENNGDDLPDFALEGNPPLGSLNCTSSRELGTDAFTIETSQKLPLETRVSQQLLFVESILAQYGMKFEMQTS